MVSHLSTQLGGTKSQLPKSSDPVALLASSPNETTLGRAGPEPNNGSWDDASFLSQLRIGTETGQIVFQLQTTPDEVQLAGSDETSSRWMIANAVAGARNGSGFGE